MSAPDTDPHPTDDRLRRAAADLRRQVASEVDTDAALERVTGGAAGGPRRGPWLAAAAAAVALVVAGALVVVTRDAPEEVTVDDRRTTSSAPDPVTDPPTGPAVGGPDDGTASLDLPVTATPRTDLHPGDTVTLAGEGFNPGRPVGVVQCTMDVIESSAGSAACDLGVLGTSSTPDAEGRASGSIPVRRVIQIGAQKVDCAADGVRCGVAMGQIDDYDVSGAAEITFADDLPPLVQPTISVSPSTGLEHGDTVTVAIDGLTRPVDTVHLCPASSASAADDDDAPLTPYGPSGAGGDRCWYGIQGNEILPEPDGDGRVTFELRVWRMFAPSQATGVVDCAVERCALVAYGGAELDPAPAVLDFDPDGPRPPQATLTVDPSSDLRVGETVEVTVSGLDPGTPFSVSACGDLTGTGSVRDQCAAAVLLAEGDAGADGRWSGAIALPDPSTYGVDCSVEWACALTVSAGVLDQAQPEVRFLPPEPVAITYATG